MVVFYITLEMSNIKLKIQFDLILSSKGLMGGVVGIQEQNLEEEVWRATGSQAVRNPPQVWERELSGT